MKNIYLFPYVFNYFMVCVPAVPKWNNLNCQSDPPQLVGGANAALVQVDSLEKCS